MLTLLLAAADSPDQSLLQYGAVGALAVVAFGLAFWLIKEMQARCARLEESNRLKDAQILSLAERFAIVAEQGIAANREARDLLIEMRADAAAAERHRGR